MSCLQTRAISEKTQALKSKHAAAVSALLQRYKQLQSEVTRYNKALDSVMSSGGGDGAGAEDVYVGRDQ
jgi:hypothetical protein